jgi:DUF4097 and DUF4098 domain-containing protein YvlB
MMVRNPLLFIFLVGLALVVSPSVSQAKDFWFDFQRIVETGPDAELELHYIDGDLEIIGTDEDRIVIDARKRVEAVGMDDAQWVADHIEIKVEEHENRVDVATNYLRMRDRDASFWSKLLGKGGSDPFGEVNWVIHVPIGCKITVVNTSGRMNIHNIRGDLNIRTSSSELTLNSIEGEMEIENSYGKTTGELLFGPVTVRQAQGKIDLEFVEGDIRIKSSSADITVRQDRGAIDLTTSAGNVDIQTALDSSRDFFVSTESGNINLTIPETSSGDIRIESETGDIHTDIPIAIKSMTRKQVEGTFGLGGVNVHLTSISGDVTVAQF